VYHPVDLLVQIEHGHFEHGSPPLSLGQLKAEVVDRGAVTQALIRPCQISFG
jgi:hypothetical protein